MECTYVLTNDIACTRVCQLPSNKKDYTVWCANMLRQRSEEGLGLSINSSAESVMSQTALDCTDGGNGQRVWVCQSIVVQNLSCLTDCSGHTVLTEATGYTPWERHCDNCHFY
jgi:hypothetical protein